MDGYDYVCVFISTLARDRKVSFSRKKNKERVHVLDADMRMSVRQFVVLIPFEQGINYIF